MATLSVAEMIKLQAEMDDDNDDGSRDDLFEFRVQVLCEDSTLTAMHPSTLSQYSHFALTTTENELIIWNLQTEEVEEVHPIDDTDGLSVRSVFFGTNDKVCILKRHLSLEALDVGTGARLWAQRNTIFACPTEDNRFQFSLVISDGKVNALLGDTVSGEQVSTFAIPDLDNGNEDEEIFEDDTDDMFVCKVSNSVVAIGRKYDVVLTIFNVSTGNKVRDNIVLSGEEIGEENDVLVDCILSKSHVATISNAGQLNIFHLYQQRSKLWSCNEVSTAAMSPNGRQLVVCDRAGRNVMWSVAAGVPSHELQQKVEISLARFSQNGSTLAGAAKETGEIYLWDVEFGNVTGILRDSENFLLDFTFSRDSSRIAACGENDTTIIWDLKDGDRQRLLALTRHHHAVFRREIILKTIKSFLF